MTRTTCVFECDVRNFEGNPHHIVTPLGPPVVVQVGDACAEIDRLLQDRAGLSAALDSLAKTAAMLHANSVQCLRDHHGVSVDEAFPPWLADALRDIEAARNLVQRMESNP